MNYALRAQNIRCDDFGAVDEDIITVNSDVHCFFGESCERGVGQVRGIQDHVGDEVVAKDLGEILDGQVANDVGNALEGGIIWDKGRNVCWEGTARDVCLS